MVYKIDLLNSICTDNYNGTGGHVQNITALNEWCVLAGGTGAHRFEISAYNELSTLYGGTGGYKYDIDALNEICVLSGGTGGHRFAVDALVELGALLNYYKEIDFLCGAITPSLSLNKSVNSGFETGNPPNNWSTGNRLLSSVDDERPGGVGSKALNAQRGVGQVSGGVITQGPFPSTIGKWYQLSGWGKNIDASGGYSIGLSNSIQSTSLELSTEWIKKTYTGYHFFPATTVFIQLRTTSEELQSARFDDISLQDINFNSMLCYAGEVADPTGTYICNPIVADNTQAGLLIRYLDESNFIYAIVDRLNHAGGATDRCRLIKVVAGVYTPVIEGVITYIDGKELRVFINANKYTLLYNGLSIGTTTEINDELGNKVYGFNSFAGNLVGQILKYKETPIEFQQLTDVSINVAVILPLNYIDGLLYGAGASSGTLHTSEDLGDTWTLLGSKDGILNIIDIRKLSDGEVIIFAINGAYRSTGWGNFETCTFELKQAVSAGSYVLRWGIDIVGEKILLTEYAVNPRDPAKKVYYSNNNGQSFSTIYNLLDHFPVVGDYHPHGVCIDHITGELYVSYGDAEHGIIYTSDEGSTWSKIDSDVLQPTTLKSAKHGIVCGSDHFPIGTFRIDRITKNYNYMNADLSVWGFGMDSARDANGNVYVCWTLSNNATQQPRIHASDGRYSNIIYELPVGVGTEISRVGIVGSILWAVIRVGDGSYKLLKATV